MVRITAAIILAITGALVIAQSPPAPQVPLKGPLPLLSSPASAAAGIAGTVSPAALFRTGQYDACIRACDDAIENREGTEDLWILKVRSELATGKYELALQTYQQGIDAHRRSVAMRLAGYEVHRANGDPEWAERSLQDVRELVGRDPRRYGDVRSRVVIGRALLLSGADARQVLELFYDTAKQLDPASPDPHVAAGELALLKQDYALAGESFAEADERSPNDPDVHFGLARAFHDDSERVNGALARALAINPRHADSLLFQADNAIDREAYAQAETLIARVLTVNPRRSEAHAYRAVLAHLRGDRRAEASHRDAALGKWKTNPAVDHLIGTKLSQKYRFFEGQLYQRVALKFDPNYRPAKVQLCQGLLRLGRDEEGWQLAAEVFKEDPYNVVAYNLNTLHDGLSQFRTLKSDGFLVRMDPREADVYGGRVLDLLARARGVLCAKYDVTMTDPTTIEIFPLQKDFAIRTFGLPGGDGYLGVCFGPLITVNSPALRMARPVNWEAIVWHEFCHAVTLHKTRNKMPRWISEGISVYEERERNRAWGQSMSPQYRRMILEDGEKNTVTPLSQLSGAFLQPPTPMHLQFAYFESSMVIEFIVERWGIDALRRVLTDLSNDVPINAALANHTEPIDQLDASFEAWLKQQAQNLAPQVDWTQPETLDADSVAMRAWNEEHPNNFWGLLGEGRALLAERKFAESKRPLSKLIELYPTHGEAGGPYVLLAAAHRELGESDAERAMLTKHVSLNADAIDPRLRLLELSAAAKEWQTVKSLADEVLAINPLVPLPHRYLAQAAEALGDRPAAIEAHRTLLQMDPLDAADHHYRLASLLLAEQQLPEARRQVIRALEEAPRFRAAHQLLLEIVAKMPPSIESPLNAVTSPTTQPATSP